MAISAGASSRVVLPMMMATVVIQQVDRNIVNVVLEPLRAEFHLSDSQLGLFAGTVFAVSYMIAGIPVGRLADRVNRRNLLAAILAIWSVLTALCGFAQSFLLLMLARIGVGAAEAGTHPITLSILSGVYPPEKRSTAGGLIYASAKFGLFVSYLTGGFVAATWGWRAAFLAAGIPGILLAILMMVLVKEPPRPAGHSAERQRPGSLWPDVRALILHPVLGWLYIAATLYTLVASGIGAWTISIMVRDLQFELQNASYTVALTTGLFGTAGTAAAGWLADRAAQGRVGNGLRIPAIAGVIFATGGWLFAVTSSVPLAVVALCLMGLTSQAHTGAVVGTISRLAAPSTLALGFALFSVIGSVLGLAIGPWLVGALSDASGSDQPLRAAMIMVLPIMALPILMLLLAARRLERMEGEESAPALQVQ